MSIASCNTCNGAGCFTDGTKCDDCGGVGCFPIHAERPSDAEGEKLVERLRHLVSLNDERNGGPYQGYAASEFVKAAAEAADAIASLTAQLAEARDTRASYDSFMKAGRKLFEDRYAEHKQDVRTATARAEAAEAQLREAERFRKEIEKVRADYVSRMKFCDIEPLPYFRDFVRRIDASLQPSPTKTGVADGQ
jgi:hypothetical protein